MHVNNALLKIINNIYFFLIIIIILTLKLIMHVSF